MATVQITKTGVYVTPTREELLANNFVEQVQDYDSPVTNIKYRLRRFVDQGKTMFFVPLIIQDEKREIKRLFISGIRRVVQQADGSTINVSDADLIVRTMPELRLVKYPDDRDPTYPHITGLHALHDAGYFFVGPKWCTAALFMLEANPGSQKVEQFTTVMSDRIPFGVDTVMERGQAVLPGLTDLQNAAVIKQLSLNATVKSIDAVTGKETITQQELKGDQLVANADFMSRFIKQVTLTPTPKISNVLIGSPFCVDLVSEFVVPQVTVPAVPVTVVAVAPVQPVAVPGGLLQGPPASTTIAVATATTGTFQPQPIYSGATTSERRIPVVQLGQKMVERLDAFMTKGKCAEGGILVRIDNLIKVIIESQSKDGGSKWHNSYLSLSTCRFAGQNKTTIGRVLKPIPGTQQTLNLSISPDDLSKIINGTTEQTLPQADWDAYVEAVFKAIETLVFEHLGTTLQQAEVDGLAVPLSILDGIPAGPSPAGRPMILARSPFVEKVALSGVTEVTVPITDGKRCLPGLMAKKRD